MFSNVIDGVEVFEVGKLQLWSWCGWTRRGYDSASSYGCEPLYVSADSLAKGRYVVIEGTAEFGRLYRRNWVVASFTSIRKAVAAVNDYVEYDAYKLGRELSLGGHVLVHYYEVWHIVDDGELWQAWEAMSDCCQRLDIQVQSMDDADVQADIRQMIADYAKAAKQRYYYVASHDYGVEFCNDVHFLLRFPTIQARDQYVDDGNWGGKRTYEPVTRERARNICPRAFGDTVTVLEVCTGRDGADIDTALDLMRDDGQYAWVRHADGTQLFDCYL